MSEQVKSAIVFAIMMLVGNALIFYFAGFFE